VIAAKARIIPASIFVILGLLFSGCSAIDQMPAAARGELLKQSALYYANPVNFTDPFDSVSKITIEKAWLAQDLPDQTSSLMWCASLSVSGQKHGAGFEQKAVWIVLPGEQQSSWIAADLETISADVPYKRCGQKVPGLST